ncbi:hypothetical protein EVAR_17205_1 [Eumeta japonica]|uniref:Uncharacterized protein n=1 Tax=Eumeta variegata TaxID=151549 RepID=A0A4C1U921_EUMVA|nr:hypothetical protein EVAR_17205_1 [Eumeta japonica]
MTGFGLKEIADFFLGGNYGQYPHPGQYPGQGGAGVYPNPGNYPSQYPGSNYPNQYPGSNYPANNYPNKPPIGPLPGSYPGQSGPGLPGSPGNHPGCPLCDSSVYSYCSHKQTHDACCCENPSHIPFRYCSNTDCKFLYANTCNEYNLISRCCCVDVQRDVPAANSIQV